MSFENITPEQEISGSVHGSRANLLAALRAKPSAPLDLAGWVRIVDYRYCLDPLSPAGSLRGIGGRFNIGIDLSTATFNTWPALYVAENLETAFREKFHLPAVSMIHGLTPEELALQSRDGYLVAYLNGRIESILDLGDTKALEPFCNVIKRYAIPKKAREVAKQLGMQAPLLVRSPSLLQRTVLTRKWRAIPTQFDLPSASQTFGGLVRDAGYEAIIFKSSQNAQRCVAIFPENLTASASYIELTGSYPVQVNLPRLDRSTWPEFQRNLH
ncbi:MAG: RES domain-containing protein [Gammaproteobacteria bacterium]|nr:RES domain-containing protein [Gammaproteobacteria bacterium]